MHAAVLRFALLALSAGTPVAMAAQQAVTAPAGAPQAVSPASAQVDPQGQQAPAAVPPASQDGKDAKAEAKAAEKLRREKEKAEAKERKDQEKARKEAEKDATYLKLQNNEIVAATFDESGNPIKLPPCARKDKECQAKRKEFLKQKKVGLRVENGTLSVDGWTGKARLNYDVKNFRFVYVSVPGYGTVVASPERFPNSTEIKDGLNGKTLTVTTADHRVIEISSDVNLAGKQKRSIYFWLDPAFTRPGSFPTMGYGFVSKAPYSWPGTLPPTDKQKQLIAKAPPLPRDMELKEMVIACQTPAPGESPKPVRVNGVLMTPPVCRPGQAASSPGAYAAGQRPPDGSGAASTGVAEPHPQP